MLTSAEGYAILLEKEDKKRKEKEEKERRKQDRIEKKREKEEASKRKAEEKAKKSAMKSNMTTRQRRKGKAQSVDDATLPTSTSHDEMTQDTRPENTQNEPATTTAVHDQDTDEDYVCCECFGTYEDNVRMGNGAEWAHCVCKRWIHVIASVNCHR